MSKRTDGGPSQPVRETGGFEYGGRQEFEELQASAPMSQAQAMPAAAPMPPTPLFAPTERATEPVTAGAPMGAGPGPAAPPTVRSQTLPSTTMYRLAQSDTTGEMARYADILAARGL